MERNVMEVGPDIFLPQLVYQPIPDLFAAHEQVV
jgi:hypothetical protein